MEWMETKVEETLSSMEALAQHAIKVINNQPLELSTGGDDSCYDYIPNGLHTIAWLAQAVEVIHWASVEGDPREDYPRFVKEHDLPALQDCVSREMYDHIIYLAIKLGYTAEDLINACAYEFEEGYNEVTTTLESFVRDYENK